MTVRHVLIEFLYIMFYLLPSDCFWTLNYQKWFILSRIVNFEVKIWLNQFYLFKNVSIKYRLTKTKR